MPAVDLSSYHQPSGSVSDGSRFDNLIDAIQGSLNGLDNANIASGAAIAASKLADPTVGKVLGSSGGACAAVYPPGYEFAYVEFTSTPTSTSTTFAGGTSIVSAGALTFDGATKIRVEVFIPGFLSSTTSANANVSLADGGAAGTDLGVILSTTFTQNIPVLGVREFTPPAATKTYSAVLWTSAAGTATAAAGAGGAGTRMPGFVRITKA